MQFTGTIAKGPFGGPTKSERQTIYLDTDDGERYLVRRLGADAFHDPVIEPLLGQRVICYGTIVGYTLLVHTIEPATR